MNMLQKIFFYFGRCPKCKKFKIKRWSMKKAYCEKCGGIWEVDGL